MCVSVDVFHSSQLSCENVLEDGFVDPKFNIPNTLSHHPFFFFHTVINRLIVNLCAIVAW